MSLSEEETLIPTSLFRNDNCSEGNAYIWEHLNECLDYPNLTVGFVFGALAIALCSISNTSLTIAYSRQQVRLLTNTAKVTVVLMWISEVLSLIGALLARQLPMQIIYCMTIIPILTICTAYVFIRPCISKHRKINKGMTRRPGGKQSILKKCMYPLYMLLPAVSLAAGITWTLPHLSAVIKQRNDSTFNPMPLDNFKEPKTLISIKLLLGYIFGAMAGTLLCCGHISDMVHAYRSLESTKWLPVMYVLRVAGGLCYVYAVLSQSLSLTFVYHTLPWTLSRLCSTGIDFGILVQRVWQIRHSRKRKLSQEGAERLMSSDDDFELTESESEEVIWVPLKLVDNMKPQHPVATSRIQIVSEIEPPIDLSDCDETSAYVELSNQEDLHGVVDPLDNNSNPDTVTVHSKLENTTDKPEFVQCEYKDNNACEKVDTTKYSQTSSTGGSESNVSDSGEPLVNNNNTLKVNIAALQTVTNAEKIASWIASAD